MVGRLLVVSGLLGVASAHLQADLPAGWVSGLSGLLVFGFALAMVAWSRTRLSVAAACPRRWPGRLFPGLVLAFAVGFLATTSWAQLRLADRLAEGNVDRVSRVELRIESLPQWHPDRVSFVARVLQAHPAGVPKRIRVSWSSAGWRSPYAAARPADPPFPELYAGQVWKMALVLRPVHSAINLHAFDYEQYAFAAGIRAQGTVRGVPEHVRDEPWVSLKVVAERARHEVRKAMDPYLQGLRYGPVLRALAIGDQDGVDDEDWRVFNRSGLTHLVSISGSHITLLAAFGALVTRFLWCRLRWKGRVLAERWPARRAAACAALLVAWLYCLLAGWGVPAQRTFLMLAVVVVAQSLQVRMSGSRTLALAAVVVLMLDPWAILSSGFWLSFLAVAVLLAVARAAGLREDAPTRSRAARLGRAVHQGARLQWSVTWALAPPLAWLFHEVSLVSPIANAYAIPVIELLVTPLSLLLALLSLVPALDQAAALVASMAHAVLASMMRPTEWLAALPTVPVAAGPPALYLLAALGAAVALWPTAAGRHRARARTRPAARWGVRSGWGWLALLPMMLWKPAALPEGAWDLHAFDVGQGSAVLVRTARHALLFDTGARHARDSDEGARTLVPALRALGVPRLDVLVLSHADLDHVGGTLSVLDAVPVHQTYSSFQLQSWLVSEARKLQASAPQAPVVATPCVAGSHWRIDGVSFEFLWPTDVRVQRRGAQSNAGSCVLRVRGAHHSLLLTGDIERASERALVARGLSAVDVVVAAHHGSRTSSSLPFVQASAARHVIIQAGRWNRYNHPDPGVLARWMQHGAQVWRTDRHGALHVRSRQAALRVHSVFAQVRRYWHTPRLARVAAAPAPAPTTIRD